MLLDKFLDEKQVINHKAALPKTGYKPVQSHVQQKQKRYDIRKDRAHGLRIIHGRIELMLAVAIEHISIYNKWDKP